MYHIESDAYSLTNAESSSWMEPLAQTERYPAGTELFRQGDAPQSVYLIARGVVKLIRSDGNHTRVSLAYPGDVLGDVATVLGESHPATAVTLTSCDLRSLDAVVFRRLLQEDATFSWQVHLAHSRELYKFFRQSSGA
jgi:CRP-like cAMP-binding protein